MRFSCPYTRTRSTDGPHDYAMHASNGRRHVEITRTGDTVTATSWTRGAMGRKLNVITVTASAQEEGHFSRLVSEIDAAGILNA